MRYLNHIDYHKTHEGEMKYGIVFLLLLALIPFFAVRITYARRKKAKTKMTTTLQVGDEAPKFVLPDENNKDRALVDYAGYKIAIYFYPKADTSSCTKQACSIRDSYDVLKKKNIVVLGISYDKPKTLKKFKDKYSLSFTLLSDRKKKVASLYNAKGGIFSFGLPKRITYLIDENRKIVKIITDVDVKKHWQQIMNGFND